MNVWDLPDDYGRCNGTAHVFVRNDPPAWAYREAEMETMANVSAHVEERRCVLPLGHPAHCQVELPDGRQMIKS